MCPSIARWLVVVHNLHWKFFVNFLQWATLFCFWTFSTLLGLNVKPRTSSDPELDPQQIVVIALFVAIVAEIVAHAVTDKPPASAGFFGLFCSLILISQLHLILLNQTTVESLSFRSMRDREQELLSQMHKWYHIGYVSSHPRSSDSCGMRHTGPTR